MDEPNQKPAEDEEIEPIVVDTGDVDLSSHHSLAEIYSASVEIDQSRMEAFHAMAESLSFYAKELFDFSALSDSISLFAKSITESLSLTISESVHSILGSISEILTDISIPSISEERKQQLLEAHIKWGTYGWTIHPCSDYETLFDTMPDSQKAADEAALKCCRKDDMAFIFSETRKCPRVTKSDYEEAVFSFENSRYKSCALLLVSMIDAKLIRLQKKSDFLEKQKRRMVGKQAVDKAELRLKNSLNNDVLFLSLFSANTFACLNKVFENGNDFKTQPVVINRNFLGHGMLTRRVTRKDCIQLFLLYYNVLELLDLLYMRK